jgi:L-serine dehydratase
MGGELSSALVEYDPNGSLVTTHASQGSDMGLFGGFLGWEAHDDRLPGYAERIAAAGIAVDIRYVSYGATHPNTYKLTLANERETHTMTAVSTGGGMIEVLEIDGSPVALAGDYHETLVYVASSASLDGIRTRLAEEVDADEVQLGEGPRPFLLLCTRDRLEDEIVESLGKSESVVAVRRLAPVLPVLSRRDLEVPFTTCEEMLAYDAGRALPLWELAVRYEAARAGLSHDEILARMTELVRIMDSSIQRGLEGTEYEDRILGCQSVTFRERMESGGMVAGDALNRAILFTTAMMEVKSSMGVIVAAPTAGSCGALPGACLGVGSALGSSEQELVRAMLAAGMVGTFVARHATFAAEVGGCMAECGAGSGMAAAAIVTLAGGSLEQTLGAASLALQNAFGLTCDPVANRVEAPCLGRNVMAASNALACANMALADFAHLIPLDEVIDAMDKIGHGIPHELRCTGLGGLSITKASKAIEARLKGRARY